MMQIIDLGDAKGIEGQRRVINISEISYFLVPNQDSTPFALTKSWMSTPVSLPHASHLVQNAKN